MFNAGGSFTSNANAGVFRVNGNNNTRSNVNTNIGFRSALPRFHRQMPRGHGCAARPQRQRIRFPFRDLRIKSKTAAVARQGGEPRPARKSGAMAPEPPRNLKNKKEGAMPIGDIYDEMTSFTALHQAYTEVTKGKREKEETLIFERNLERNLHELSHDLRNGKVPQARYGSFYVYVPKARKVIYADLTTKIIQRAIYDAINPRITKQLVADTYACIPGRGQLAAMERVRGWMEMTRNEPGMWGYYKYDAAKFFYRIDHGILMWLLGKKISDLRLLDLLGYYIDGTGMAFGLPPGRDPLEVTEDEMLADVGIPIGGGLSHTLGNVYLDPLDQYIKRDLRCRRYARYMDDGIIFDNDRERLRENAKRIEEFANVRLALEFNSKTAIRPASRGVEWVGYDIYDDHVRLRKSTTLHMKRRLKKTMEDYRDGRITLHDAGQTVAAYKALLKHCDMDRFDDYIWNQFFVLQRGEATADGHRQNATGQRV